MVYNHHLFILHTAVHELRFVGLFHDPFEVAEPESLCFKYKGVATFHSFSCKTNIDKSGELNTEAAKISISFETYVFVLRFGGISYVMDRNTRHPQKCMS